ncbi:methyl-accepting chemotaxis protein [Ramlibacter sp. 2FC]|uniref:methyl-accepting chemotaxis protein n=1 Tax=Ramlibacter sp. 2FC TaxID=2502188 RepID=UPI0010F6FE54|nr:methyl-accepting chemotaxis protein [Ramlibacter sp. 2FC]
MTWMLDLSTRNKLFVGFGLMLALLAGAGLTAYQSVSAILASQRVLQQEFADAVDLLELRTDINGSRASLLRLLLAQTPAEREVAQQDIRQREQEGDEALRQLQGRKRDDAQPLAQIQEIVALRNVFNRTRNAQIMPLIQAGQTEQALAMILGAQEQRYLQMRQMAQALGEEALRRARAAETAAEQRSQAAMVELLVLGLVALGFGLAMALWLSRMIAGPLRDVADIAGRVAAGDLTAALPVEPRGDEVGDLLKAFHAMTARLRTSTREIHAGVNVLASSSNEILATISQVAAGAAQTAAAVGQTTVTVEEVKQTAQLSSQKARHVSDSAQRAAQVSQGGRLAVEGAIAGMQRIQDQMASIADSVVQLGEQGQTIGEIIAMVSQLAERSNLLAVNAAIEAARAGEEGKGFAVVAQEVKSLAEQSKQATAQVRTILGDIQKATSATVLATEQGHKVVAAGIQQSADAAQAIRQLAESIDEAAQAATQIAASSQQQMVGMDQVGQAMHSIKQASLQNAAGTRQAETAAQGLHELGARLRQQVALYQL